MRLYASGSFHKKRFASKTAGSTITNSIEFPQDNVCKELIEEPRHMNKNNVQEMHVLCTK